MEGLPRTGSAPTDCAGRWAGRRSRPRLVESPAHLGTKLQRGGFGLGVVPIYDGTAGK
ncbi:hypothetical protein [Prevotella histicola]|uniref:hypothetical protein n=1 Tax=uncultured Prevotella sp. TaxID=159272 RepID=UPI00259B8CBB|nr:hypothetical protein [Prevotella histicola]